MTPNRVPSSVVAPGGSVRLAAVAVMLLVGSTVHAPAWTPEARVRMTRDAVRLMPASLRKLMRHHQKELASGLLHPGSAEDSPDHWQHPAGEYGTAAREAEMDARALIAGMNAHEPMESIVRRFGVLAHRIGDVNNPLHAADRHPALARYYADYQRYLEGVMDRFRLVFHGYRAPLLQEQGPEAFLLASAQRSREYAAAVRRAYGDDGRRLSAEAFDVRSLAFGVGSLSYSHAVNDIVRVWLWAWEGSHGDTTETPYPLDPPVAAAAPSGRPR